MFSSKMTATFLIGVDDAAVVGGGDALDIEMPSTAAPAARTPMPPAMSFFPVRNGVSPFRTVGRRSCCRAPRPPAWERNAHRGVTRVTCCQQQVTDPLRLCNPGGQATDARHRRETANTESHYMKPLSVVDRVPFNGAFYEM